MLRRLDESANPLPPTPGESSAFPSLDQAFVLGERPPGIRFYQGRSSFFHPYALLQSMTYDANELKVVFADADVLVQGRGLHELYQQLADHRVACVVEQGARADNVNHPRTHITRIKGAPRTRKQKKQQSSNEAESAEPLQLDADE